MVSISTDESILTVIHAYEVMPEHQQELAARLVEAIELHGHTMAGHLSSSVHIAKDGKRVTSYSQWAADEARALFDDPKALDALLDAFKPYIALATGQDFAMYGVLSSKAYRQVASEQ